MAIAQKLVPGIVGISTYVDAVYHAEMQQTALAASGEPGPINRLRTVTVTLDFKQLLANLFAGDIAAAEEQVADAAFAIERAGADFVVVTSGTTSTLTARARERVRLPFLDLADAAMAEAVAGGAPAIGLVATRRAAGGGIFQAAAEARRAQLLTPPPDTAARIDAVIFDELVCGTVTDTGVSVLRDAIAALAQRGARAVILGNTDMTLAAARLAEAAPVPLVDGTRAHARAAARAALAGRDGLAAARR
jgi:aspartate racemase